MKQTGLNGYVDDFSVDYDVVVDILDIHKYLTKKHDIKQCLDLLKKMFIATMTFISRNTLKCISVSDQECKVRPAIMNINSTEPL